MDRLLLPTEPVREVSGDRKLRTVRYPSRKMGKHIKCESHIERDALVLIECDHTVSFVAAQPERISLGGKKYAVPDFLIIRSGEPVLVEVKSERFAFKPEVAAKLKRIAAAYAEKGQKYEVWLDTQIRAGHKLSICKYMWRYAPKKLPLDHHQMIDAQALCDLIPEGQTAIVGDLFRQFGARLPSLLALAHAFMEGLIDLDFGQPFSDRTTVSRRPLTLF